jgi:hypothetical protein
MISEFNHEPVAMEQDIQVYRNDFYSGFVRLVRKLFMF